MSEPGATSGWASQGPPGPAAEPSVPPPWWTEATSEMTGTHRSGADPRQGPAGGRHLHAVPSVGGTAPPAPPPRSITIADTFRGAVVARLRKFSYLHARHAWDQRRSDPLAPHGVALFYLEPRDRQFEQLRTATRIFLADDEARSLPHLLYGLAQHAREGYATDPRFDPRAEMVNRFEEMTRAAVFVGVGVVTLDTPLGSWEEAQRRARNEQDLPGRCFARLIDDTMLLIDRGGATQFNTMSVECSVRDGNLQYGSPSMRWKWNATLAETPEDDHTFHVWRWMIELSRIIDQGSQPR